jgi:hypothetical protein
MKELTKRVELEIVQELPLAVVGQPEIGLPSVPAGANASDNLSAEAERFTADMTARRLGGTFVSPAFQRRAG